MSQSVSPSAAPAGGAVADAAEPARGLVPGELAWLAAVPCIVLVLGLVAVLGPPLGNALLAPRGMAFWPSVAGVQPIRPEPVEHARYLLALLGPLLLCGVVAARPAISLPPRRIRLLVTASQITVVALLLVAFTAQRLMTYGAIYGGPLRRVYFTWPTLAVASAVAVLLVAASRRRTLVARATGWLRETPAKRVACLVTAALLTAAWLLTAVNLDVSIGHTTFAVNVTLPFVMDETYAVLNGRTPLVDFHAQYGQLWPYAAALPMALLGASTGTYTVAMATGTALCLLAVFALLRRVTRSSLAALALFLPFMATGFFIMLGPPDDRFAPSNLFTIFPIRYGGPYLLAWLTIRHVDGVAPHRLAPLFAAAGLVALNNPEFGLSAAGATFAALLWTQWPLTRGGALRLAAGTGAGLLIAGALVSLLTLVRTGALPSFGLLFEFARIDGVEGWTLAPMPTLGLHLVVFATFAAALVVATVRAVGRHEDAVLTAALAWAGVFGLGAGSYFVGRSHPEVLIDLFSAWALALVLLTIVVVRALAARTRPLPTLPELAVLFGLGLLVCSLAQVPTPWSQIARLGDRGVEGTAHYYMRFPAADRFVAQGTYRGEQVLILLPLSHRTAYEHGLTNVGPWVSIESMPTPDQLDEAVRALREAGGRKLFLWSGNMWDELMDELPKRGFELSRSDPGNGLMEWVD